MRRQQGFEFDGVLVSRLNSRAVFPAVEQVSDEPGADLLTQRMQVHEKNTWMLRSLLEK
jgi:DNA-binding ferritin-like protein